MPLSNSTMDQLVQCPVCTLFLHSGMSLECHLDTHPKDQVIKALCSLTNKSSSSCESRTPTPLNSETSYRSRSRTPAPPTPEARWNSSHRSNEQERFWRRTPSRSSKPMSVSRNATPDLRLNDLNYDNHLNNSVSGSGSQQHSGAPYLMKSDRTQQSYQGIPISDYDSQYYCADQPEDREIKYSRTAEYNSALDNSVNPFTYNVPPLGIKLLPGPRRVNNLIKMLPKSNNLLLKSNIGGVQYIAPGGKPMRMMVPTATTFVQKNLQNNMILSGNLPNTTVRIESKQTAAPVVSQLNQTTSGNLSPGTTVVTQNSQIIYRETVQNIDGKPFVTSIPSVLGGQDNVANLAQGSSMYQNVMVLDQFGNTSCMYSTPPTMPVKSSAAPRYTESTSVTTCASNLDKTVQNLGDPKSLIIEVKPIGPQPTAEVECKPSGSKSPQTKSNKHERTEKSRKRTKDAKPDTPGSSKGLKILSNIKVEVPVQHHKNMVNTIMDLTGSNDSEYIIESAETPEKILPDLEESLPVSPEDTQPSVSSAASEAPHTFTVIKNVGNPPSYKESSKNSVDNKIETESSDSCPVPDLICNEKPSISPCSELSENCDNSTDHTSISPKPETTQVTQNNVENKEKNSIFPPAKTYRHNTLRLNNIYVKKNKRVLQIKNSKATTISNTVKTAIETMTSSSSSCIQPENFTMNKLHQADKSDGKEKSCVSTISIKRIKSKVEHDDDNNDNDNNFDADTEEQSMDLEPAAPSTMNRSNEFPNMDVVQVKEEISTSNEGGFSNQTVTSDRDLAPMESLRPINIISYGNMPTEDFDDESNDKELLDLEAASKNKQFVSMMNENYFGDNIYADYFTPDRVESFGADREAAGFKEQGKEGMYGIWGEPSQKQNDFVLPNFIHESYKIAESAGLEYSELEGEGDSVKISENDAGEGDSKMEVLSESRSEDVPLNICADERMPPRGELSGQESNGDMDSHWSGMYTEVTPAEPYDLIARESWVSDGSEIDATEKTEPIEDELQYPKPVHTCPQCGVKFCSLKEMRAHKGVAHALPTCSDTKTTYSRLVTTRTIKKEEKPDTIALGSSNLLAIDSKESISSTILQVYDPLEASETKPKLETLIKQEPKRRRKDYVCPTCKVDQVTDAAFHAHLKIHPLECLTCGKCFFRRPNLALHIKTHLGIKNYKCEVCEKRFLTRQKLMEHHNVHTGRTPVKCTHCDETFRRYSNMVQHRDRHHLKKRGKVRDYVCSCGSVFHSVARLQWHRETHDNKPKACLYCSDKFVHAASLTRHVRRAHNQYFVTDPRGKADNVPCPVCNQVYLRVNLRSHLLTHSGQRPFHCVVCDKSFTTKWNLKLHRWTHVSRSGKPFKCNQCAAAFVRQTEFIAHLNAHRSVRPYTCNYCGCQFVRKYNCQRHVREHEMAKRFVCNVPECGKSFHRSYYLSEHMKVHSGARPFSCNICGKTSSNKSNHNKHLKIHHAREPVATEA